MCSEAGAQHDPSWDNYDQRGAALQQTDLSLEKSGKSGM
jgi:hypothetical protein